MNRLQNLLLVAFAAIMRFAADIVFGPPAFRVRTCDVAFSFRMGGGFPGDVNRMHPASILPGLLDAGNPFRAYGEAALFGSASNYRPVIAGDASTTAVNIAGLLVRPYPTQQTSGGMNASIGAATPPATGAADFLRAGYMVVKMKAGVAVKKGDPVWIWAIATAGANIQGEYQAAATASSTVPVANARFNGPADASGNVELEVWAA